jgi:hypothetical protein
MKALAGRDFVAAARGVIKETLRQRKRPKPAGICCFICYFKQLFSINKFAAMRKAHGEAAAPCAQRPPLGHLGKRIAVFSGGA